MGKVGKGSSVFWFGLCFFALPHSVAQPGEPTSGLPLLPGMLEKSPLDRPLSLPAIEKMGTGQFRLGVIEIDRHRKTVRFPAFVNMDKGLLEYLLVRSSGKVHESLLRTSVDPYHLQIALLLLGFEGTNRPLAFQGDQEKPVGEPVEILLSLSRFGEKPEGPEWIRAEQWVTKKVDERFEDLTSLEWVYTGSVVLEGRFLAQVEGSFIALYHDPAALIDNASPGGESDEIWFVKEGVVPPVGTPVTVMIRSRR